MTDYLTEEEQIENIKQFFKKYSTHLITFISVILLSFGIFQYMNWHKSKQNNILSGTYENMMIAVSNHNSEQIEAYAKNIIDVSRKSVYKDAAFLALAKLKAEAEDYAAAKEYLGKVNYFHPLKELAKIRIARIQCTENLFDEALNTLELVKSREYLPIINETKGDIYAKMKRFDEALKYYNLAAEDEYLKNTGNTFLEIKINETRSHAQKSNT